MSLDMLGAGESSNSGNVLVQNGCGDSLLIRCDEVRMALHCTSKGSSWRVGHDIHAEGNDIYYREV